MNHVNISEPDCSIVNAYKFAPVTARANNSYYVVSFINLCNFSLCNTADTSVRVVSGLTAANRRSLYVAVILLI